jgi:hypothetical protein
MLYVKTMETTIGLSEIQPVTLLSFEQITGRPSSQASMSMEDSLQTMSVYIDELAE